jgi:peptidoglycan/LPS O-acetylase OafA/YrhL
MKYRADIDGLRAVAVVSVVIYHLNETFLSGGFVGVDIFFVISGYLITKLIVSELSTTHTFSFKNFYLRRVRRLFPALFFTFLFSLLLAYKIFSPQHLANFGESVVYATTSLSNFLFWSQSSYFDQQNLFKPLLHTWSLSIEEQFYLVWPALLFFLFLYAKKRFLPIALLFIGACSLLLNLYFLYNAEEMLSMFMPESESSLDIRSTMFYLLPFRVFEFVIGAIIVWAPSYKNIYRRDEILFLIGFAAIGYSLFIFNGETIFPYFNALWPSVGAALIIVSGPNHAFSGLLRNKAMVGIGLISYSLYLIHWPIIVFYNYWKSSQLGSVDYLLIAVASTLLAVFMYRFVEQPFRKSKSAPGQSNKPFLRTSFALAALLCLVSWNAYSSAGWLWRYPAHVIKQLDYSRGDYTEFFWREMTQYQGDFARNGKTKVLLVGDSMAADLLNALSAGGVTHQLDIASFNVAHHCRGLLPLPSKHYPQYYGGNKDRCLKEHTRLQDDPRLAQADAIVLASYWWEPRYIQFLGSTINFLNQNYDAKVFVSGLKDQESNGMFFFSKNVYVPQIDKLRTPVHPNVEHINNALQKIPEDFVFFSLLSEFCDAQGCQRVTKDRRVIIFDQSHMSPAGAQFVGKNLAQTAWVDQLRNSALPSKNN